MIFPFHVSYRIHSAILAIEVFWDFDGVLLNQFEESRVFRFIIMVNVPFL